MSLHVVKPGLATRIVDAGRPRTRSLGVPVGGAADRWSLSLANALVGNPPDAAALEFSLAGPTLRADVELACVIFGPPFEVFSERQELCVGTTYTLTPGEEIHIGGTREGMRGYLAVQGGLHTPVILGSRSSLEHVKAGEDLPCAPGRIGRRRFGEEVGWRSPGPELRVLAGLQADWFDDGAFYVQEFTVTPASDRMGLRLRGRPLTLPNRELVSEPVCPGAIQVTRDGQCIVLGIDGQTIGGYPKIAQVVSADLDNLGQLRPGEAVHFTQVTLDVALQWYRRREQALGEWIVRAQISAGV